MLAFEQHPLFLGRSVIGDDNSFHKGHKGSRMTPVVCGQTPTGGMIQMQCKECKGLIRPGEADEWSSSGPKRYSAPWQEWESACCTIWNLLSNPKREQQILGMGPALFPSGLGVGVKARCAIAMHVAGSIWPSGPVWRPAEMVKERCAVQDGSKATVPEAGSRGAKPPTC